MEEKGVGEGKKEERDILGMGAVHDDEAIHQFRVPLDHTPEEIETEALGSTSGLEESAAMVAHSFHITLTNNRRLQYFSPLPSPPLHHATTPPQSWATRVQEE